MNTIISKLVWVTGETEELLGISELIEKYFKRENMKFRNMVDGLQTMLIEGKLSVKTARVIKNAISTETIVGHSLCVDLEGFIESGDLSRQDTCDAIRLAIHYFKNKEHTKILRYLYETILK